MQWASRALGAITYTRGPPALAACGALWRAYLTESITRGLQIMQEISHLRATAGLTKAEKKSPNMTRIRDPDVCHRWACMRTGPLHQRHRQFKRTIHHLQDGKARNAANVSSDSLVFTQRIEAQQHTKAVAARRAGQAPNHVTGRAPRSRVEQKAVPRS